MPRRSRALLLILAVVTGALSLGGPEPARAGSSKVAIIVGPVGGLTSSYRAWADEVATAATAAGATVATAYSPNATWANVKAAVEGANVIVYFGHGNGYPNPYTPGTELTDRTNGWGLNRTTTGGNNESGMVYCGEKALLGTLPADGSSRGLYCGGDTNTDGISPAPGFVMVYAQAHYAPGFGERYQPSDPHPTLDEAKQRVRNYSYPVLALGASAYFATAYGDADDIVTRVLTQSGTSYGAIFAAGRGYAHEAVRVLAHPDVGGAEVWVQRTVVGSWGHFGDPDYWYAFAGNPSRTPSGGTAAYAAPPNPNVHDAPGGTTWSFSDIAGSPFRADIEWLAASGITGGCGNGRFCPEGPVTRAQMASFLVRGLGLTAGGGANLFTDDTGSIHEADINRLATAGITGGCAPGRFCPDAAVTRAQMASFLVRAFALSAGANANLFTDDDGSLHEADINRLATAGITGGCGAGRYCPDGVVTRGQMAAFLRRAFRG